VILLLRAVARFVVLVLLVALALAGLAAAVFSIQGGDRPLSLPGLAEHIRLVEVEETVGDYLDQLEADGPLAKASALAGAGAVLAGLLLLLGVLAPRRERLVVFDDGEAGRLAARRRTLARVAEALAEQARGVTEAKARVRPRGRLRKGRLRVRVSHPRKYRDSEVEERVLSAVSPLVDSSGLKPRVEARVGKGRAKVE
jgi:Family of unknown function (DUF6286)